MPIPTPRTASPPPLPPNRPLPPLLPQSEVRRPVVSPEVRPEAPFWGRDGKRYHPDPDLIAATNAALLLEMPLLLAGEPGCGKTHFAWAVAGALDDDDQQRAGVTRPSVPTADTAELKDDPRQPLVCYVRSDTRARDLLYRYDAVRRFGDAQEGGDASRVRAQDARGYVQLEGLGLALQSLTRRVLLIDEIDKAPRDLPNDLLNELDQGDFEIPEIPVDPLASLPSAIFYRGVELRRYMTRRHGAQKPLVVITSNAERQLPEPFLRRCVFFHIQFPTKAQLRQILCDHWDTNDPDGSRLPGAAVEVLLALREQPLTKKPATAELLSWGQALVYSSRGAELTRAVCDLASAIRNSQIPAWSAIPLPGCLLKLHEDWIALGLRPRPTI